ncbi:MAG: hypothetical protein JWQ18_2714 [Conexibacter sp.]|nr:hypothetical protein [Conexibacter sp.]
MPIIERTPRKCFDVFTGHLRALVAATVTARHPIGEIPTQTRLQVGFREDVPIAVPVDTDFGRLHFYLGQALEAIEESGRYRLTTQQYWYRLQHGASLREQAVIRWEYEATMGRSRHARHHAQLRADLDIGDGTLDLNRAHLPTGWVTIEEVIRFLIVDLGMVPPCGDRWPDVLEQSERAFFEDFTGKRYKPSPERP